MADSKATMLYKGILIEVTDIGWTIQMNFLCPAQQRQVRKSWILFRNNIEAAYSYLLNENETYLHNQGVRAARRFPS